MFKRNYHHYSFFDGQHVPQSIATCGPIPNLCAIYGPFLIHKFCHSIFTNWRASTSVLQQGLNFKCRKILLQ